MLVMVLPPTDLTKLAKLLRMLGSDYDGERAAAGRMIHQFVVTRNVEWDALLQPVASQSVAQVAQAPEPRTWRVVVEEILAFHYAALRQPKELDFLTGMLDRGYTPSDKQAIWLTDICRRTGVPLWDAVP
jgi:hypothetical protein